MATAILATAEAVAEPKLERAIRSEHVCSGDIFCENAEITGLAKTIQASVIHNIWADHELAQTGARTFAHFVHVLRTIGARFGSTDQQVSRTSSAERSAIDRASSGCRARIPREN